MKVFYDLVGEAHGMGSMPAALQKRRQHRAQARLSTTYYYYFLEVT